MNVIPTNEQLDERAARRKQQNVARVLKSRSRRKSGGFCFLVELDSIDIDRLVQIGVLVDAERGNLETVKAGFRKMAIAGCETLKAKAPARPVATVSVVNQHRIIDLGG